MQMKNRKEDEKKIMSSASQKLLVCFARTESTMLKSLVDRSRMSYSELTAAFQITGHHVCYFFRRVFWFPPPFHFIGKIRSE